MPKVQDHQTGARITTREQHSPEPNVFVLTKADKMLTGGTNVANVCRELGVSE